MQKPEDLAKALLDDIALDWHGFLILAGVVDELLDDWEWITQYRRRAVLEVRYTLEQIFRYHDGLQTSVHRPHARHSLEAALRSCA